MRWHFVMTVVDQCSVTMWVTKINSRGTRHSNRKMEFQSVPWLTHKNENLYALHLIHSFQCEQCGWRSKILQCVFQKYNGKNTSFFATKIKNLRKFRSKQGKKFIKINNDKNLLIMRKETNDKLCHAFNNTQFAVAILYRKTST